MYENVLVPTDGSDGTRQAVVHGATIAERFDATLHALSIVPEGPYGNLEGEAGREAAERDAELAVEQVEDEARRKGIETTTAVRRGVPDEEILEYADEREIDMIVMGTHGRTGLDRVLVGSVTETVVRKAEVPVVTVRVSSQVAIPEAEDAADLALEVLAEEGYDDATVEDEPHRTSGSWIVPARTDEGRVHVHVDAMSGEARLARIDR